MKKILLAGVLGGAALFLWGGISHMALGLGAIGMSALPPEAEASMAAMRGSVPQSGLYFFPGMDRTQFDEAAMKEWEARVAEGPWGLMVYHSGGGSPMNPVQLMRELASNIFIGLLLAWLVFRSGWELGTKILAITVVGVVVSADILFSHWNWYGFPVAYTVAQSAIVIVGYAIMGTVIALLTRGAAQPRPARSVSP